MWLEGKDSGARMPLGIDNIYLVKKKAGDGVRYEIRDKSGNVYLGWLAGFENKYGSIPGYGEKEEMFHLYNTGMMSASKDWDVKKIDPRVDDDKYKNRGIYRKAVQMVANLYPKGLYVRRGEASSLLRQSLAKMDTYAEYGDPDDKILVIKPSGVGI